MGRMMNEGILADVPGIKMPDLFELTDDLKHVLSVLNASGFGTWVVGGAVRDSIIGIEPHEFDVATDAIPDEIIESFEDTIPTGIKYGTITVKTGNSQFEVTTLRSERGYGDGRRPDEVEWGKSLAVDLSRRDFTMNAMAYDYARGLLHDPFHGRQDLENGMLRAVGEAQHRLSEDGLRIMRAYRFMDRGEAGIWAPDEPLSAALIDNRAMLSKVSVERIWNELSRICTGLNGGVVLARMNRDGILLTIVKAVISLNSFEQISLMKQDLEARLALLLQDQDHNEIETILKTLKAPSKIIQRVKHLHFLVHNTPKETELRLYRAVIGNEVPTHVELMYCTSQDSKLIKKSMIYPTDIDCLVDGEWIMKRTGLTAGIKLGRLKEWLHRIQIERGLSNKDDIENVLCTIPWQHGDPKEWPRVKWP